MEQFELGDMRSYRDVDLRWSIREAAFAGDRERQTLLRSEWRRRLEAKSVKAAIAAMGAVDEMPSLRGWFGGRDPCRKCGSHINCRECQAEIGEDDD